MPSFSPTHSVRSGSRLRWIDDGRVLQPLPQKPRAAIDLTPKEYAVLEYLMRHAGKVMSRTLITEYAWGYHFDPGTNLVDVYVKRLREKIDDGFEPKLLQTVRGVGYVMKEN